MNNDIVIEAWNTVLFDKFSRFRHLLIDGLSSHSEEALYRQAHFDELTGLINRHAYLSAGYVYEKQDSNQSRFEYRTNRWFLTLGVEL